MSPTPPSARNERDVMMGVPDKSSEIGVKFRQATEAERERYLADLAARPDPVAEYEAHEQWLRTEEGRAAAQSRYDEAQAELREALPAYQSAREHWACATAEARRDLIHSQCRCRPGRSTGPCRTTCVPSASRTRRSHLRFANWRPPRRPPSWPASSSWSSSE